MNEWNSYLVDIGGSIYTYVVTELQSLSTELPIGISVKNILKFCQQNSKYLQTNETHGWMFCWQNLKFCQIWSSVMTNIQSLLYKMKIKIYLDDFEGAAEQ